MNPWTGYQLVQTVTSADLGYGIAGFFISIARLFYGS